MLLLLTNSKTLTPLLLLIQILQSLPFFFSVNVARAPVTKLAQASACSPRLIQNSNLKNENLNSIVAAPLPLLLFSNLLSYSGNCRTMDVQHDAHAKVERLKLSTPSTSCEEDLEDKAFHSIMNGGKLSKRRQRFGYRVKKGDVYGVSGLLRKQGHGKGKMKVEDLNFNLNSSSFNKKTKNLDKLNEEPTMKYNENNKLLKSVVTQFSKICDAMRNGKALFLDAA